MARRFAAECAARPIDDAAWQQELERRAGIDQWLSTSVINRAMWLAHVDPEDDRLPRAGAWHGGPGDLGGMIAGGRA
jgi:hypothetical protein